MTTPDYKKPPHPNSKPNLTDNQRTLIYEFLLVRQKDLATGELKYGSINEAAQHFKVTRETIRSIWNRAKLSKLNGEEVVDVSSNIKRKSGRKRTNLVTEEVVEPSLN